MNATDPERLPSITPRAVYTFFCIASVIAGTAGFAAGPMIFNAADNQNHRLELRKKGSSSLTPSNF
jgi:hypothetical protein